MDRVEWTNIESVSEELTDSFNSGNPTFDRFLRKDARRWQYSGEASTYIIADKEEIEKDAISRIYGYATINATGLLYNFDGNPDERQYLSCAEIRMFAIQKALRRGKDLTKDYSDIIFNLVLQNLFSMATRTIGFKAIFLNSNHDGRRLYEDAGFEEISDFIVPTTEEKVDLEGTTPMLMIINDDFIDKVFS